MKGAPYFWLSNVKIFSTVTVSSSGKLKFSSRFPMISRRVVKKRTLTSTLTPTDKLQMVEVNHYAKRVKGCQEKIAFSPSNTKLNLSVKKDEAELIEWHL